MMSVAVDWTALLAQFSEDCLGAVVVDKEFRIRAATASALELAGLTEDEAIGLSALEVVHPDDLRRAAEVLAEVVESEGERAEGMYRLRSVAGHRGFEPFTLRATNLGPDHDHAVVFKMDPASPRVRAQAFAEDVTDAMLLLAEEAPLDVAIEWIVQFTERHVDGLRLAVTIFDTAGQPSVVTHAELPEALRRDNESAHPLSLPAHVQRALDEHRLGQWRVFNRTGVLDDAVPGRLTSVIVDHDKNILGYVEALRVSDDAPSDFEWVVHGLVRRILTAVILRHRLDLRLRHAADHDPLTGLLNRRGLMTRMEGAVNPAGSMLLVIDLDRFSWINNTLGHLVGDAALVSAANCLLDACPAGSLVSRIGGDEFVVWVPADVDAPSNEHLGRALREAMAVPVDSRDRRDFVRASIGAVTLEPGEAPGEAISRADAAMYAAKRAGGDQVHHG